MGCGYSGAAENVVASHAVEELPSSTTVHSKISNNPLKHSDHTSASTRSNENDARNHKPDEQLKGSATVRGIDQEKECDTEINSEEDRAHIENQNETPVAENIVGYGRAIDSANKPDSNTLVIYFLVRVRLANKNGKSRHIVVYRRYNQFRQIRTHLMEHKNEYGKVPNLPRKKLRHCFGVLDFLNQRLIDLNNWLRLVQHLPNIDRNETFSSFLTDNANVPPEGFSAIRTVDVIGMSHVDTKFNLEDIKCSSGAESEDEDVKVVVRNQVGKDANEKVEASLPASTTKAPIKARTSIKAIFELAAKKCSREIFFDGIIAFGTAPDKTKLLRKTVVYYELRVRYIDELLGNEKSITIYRRYSQFETLRENLLRSHLHGDNILPLPKKRLVGHRNTDQAVQRKVELGDWLRVVSKLPEICNDEFYRQFMTENENTPPDGFQLDHSYEK